MTALWLCSDRLQRVESHPPPVPDPFSDTLPTTLGTPMIEGLVTGTLIGRAEERQGKHDSAFVIVKVKTQSGEGEGLIGQRDCLRSRSPYSLAGARRWRHRGSFRRADAATSKATRGRRWTWWHAKYYRSITWTASARLRAATPRRSRHS